jgi:hypothetical protein
MSDLITMMSAAAGAGGEETDPNFNQTVLLLHGDGTNGAQNNTFLDSSSNTFTITRNGNTTQGTFSPFSAPDGRWSNYFDGTDDGLSIANVAATQVGSNNFTFQCWFYPTSDSVTSRNIFGQGTSAVFSPFNVQQYGTEIAFMISQNGSSWVYGPINAGTVLINDWNHVAVVRDGTGFALFLNGTRTHNTTLSGALMTPTQPTTLGVRPANDQDYIGWISNWQLVNGTALYDPTETTCTVPTSPLPTGQTDQELLLCYSNRFVDSNTDATAKTVTVVGDVKVTPFSPFLPSAAYDPSVNGGSGYFDGSGDYLTVPDNPAWELGSNNFTIESWVYQTTQNGYDAIVSQFRESTSTGSSWTFETVGSTLSFYWAKSGVFYNADGPSALKLNCWNHIAAVRNGSNITVYINGIGGTPVVENGSIATSATNVLIGALYNTAGTDAASASFWDGYISNLRIINGTAVYTAAFTPPTAPFEESDEANTELLLNFTNAGIFDNAGKNNLETAADAQIDTSVKKYGTGSMEFDGTGDWLIMKDTPEMVFGTGDFTIEFWVNTNQTVNEFAVVDFRTVNGFFPFIAHDSTRGVFYYLNSDYRIESNTVLTTGIWYHIAVARSGSSTKLFINGTQAGSTYTNSNSLSVGANRPAIGINGESLGTLPLNGYIDDLRITKGVARYTAAFTPPTAAFPNL